MQYKIPVQIENEDPIMLGLSLRQLMIIMVAWGFAYLVFNSLEPNIGGGAFLPSGIILVIGIFIAIFKHSGMTFIPFVLSLIRLNIFPRKRIWKNTVDSFSCLDIGFVLKMWEKKQSTIDLQEKIDTMSEMQEKLKKL